MDAGTWHAFVTLSVARAFESATEWHGHLLPVFLCLATTMSAKTPEKASVSA